MISDIDDGSVQGKRQFDITLTPAGFRMGLTPGTIAAKIIKGRAYTEIRRQASGCWKHAGPSLIIFLFFAIPCL